MKDKQHELIIKAFIQAKTPEAIRRYAPNLINLDSVIGGYCTQLLKSKGKIELISNEIITKEEINIFSQLINETTGEEKEELIIYYRLLRLTEAIIHHHS